MTNLIVTAATLLLVVLSILLLYLFEEVSKQKHFKRPLMSKTRTAKQKRKSKPAAQGRKSKPAYTPVDRLKSQHLFTPRPQSAPVPVKPKPIATPKPKPIATSKPKSIAPPVPESVSLPEPEPIATPAPKPITPPVPEPITPQSESSFPFPSPTPEFARLAVQPTPKLIRLLNGDRAAADRLLKSAQIRNPDRTERWILEKVQWDLERDRLR